MKGALVGSNKGRPIRYPKTRANGWEEAWIPTEQESPYLPCTGEEMLFSSPYHRSQLKAAALCEECGVIAQCRDRAIAQGEAWGVWGGLTPGQREDARGSRHEAV